MRRVPHSWRQAYEAALIESDPNKLIGRIEYALNALERRYADWGIDPGTPAELIAIQECILALQRLMRQQRLERHAANPSNYESPESSIGITSPLLSLAGISGANRLKVG
jgi:hypothetical protein